MTIHVRLEEYPIFGRDGRTLLVAVNMRPLILVGCTLCGAYAKTPCLQRDGTPYPYGTFHRNGRIRP